MWIIGKAERGFTLIELSIVLVIIGLIVGGVLVGQDLIRAAAVRAQVTQIEKFQTAVNTFYEKTGYLPGDIPAAPATMFGLIPRGNVPATGDGNGLIEGNYQGRAGINSTSGIGQSPAETTVFWTDLSTMHLIEGGFHTDFSFTGAAITPTSTPGLNDLFPSAKIGNGNYVYIWSNNSLGAWTGLNGSTANFFGLSVVSTVGTGGSDSGDIYSTPGLTVTQAFMIDSKVDDGLPQSGNVTAAYVNPYSYWSILWAGNPPTPAVSSTAATAGSNSSCFDNSSDPSGTPGVAGVIQHYSREMSGGANVNCALSFKMQVGN